MASFQLKQGDTTFDCDPFGNVSVSGSAGGTWTTNKQNQIEIARPDGSTVANDVGWQFDNDNHLCLFSGGEQIFDFHDVPGNRPLCGTLNAVLMVRPDRGNAFTFQLRGDWSLDDGHDLNFTVNGVKSVIDGFIDDPRGRFMYHFRNKQDITEESILGFVGRWQQNADAQAQGQLVMDFIYKREDGSEATFTLPKSMIINRVNNQLLYQYDKNNEVFSVQIAGFLKVSKDFEISYTIDRQVSGSGAEQVRSTTVTVAAVFTKPNISGDLQLALKKADGTAGETSLNISGNFTAMLGASQLQVGFSFSQVRAGNKVNTTIGFSGTLNIANNGQIQWTFEKNAQQLTVAISAANIKIGAARLDGRLNLTTQGGQLVGVYGLLGVSF
jgi:hypothetical protein